MKTGLEIAHCNQGGFDNLYNKILDKSKKEIADFIMENISKNEMESEPYFLVNSCILMNSDINDIKLLFDNNDSHKFNDFNKLFRRVNSKLAYKGMYIFCTESSNNRISETNKRFNHKNYSFAEILGRLVYCGFEIMNYKNFETSTCIICKKISEPKKDAPPSTSVILKMPRIGKGGEMINIYKIRTMYPYSEFLQDYVVQKNGYDKSGKPDKDFRLLKYGKLIRRFYIDEIPQFINLLKGDINIIGVRPLSQSGLKYLPPDIQEERMKYKPGLIPPQIALRLRGINGVIKAERKYLEEVKKNQVKTNIKYFFLAFFNIVTFKVKGN
jgi:lipopolysaccharide/colanic/teichoic acid biosynthesis glycosyltransferase